MLARGSLLMHFRRYVYFKHFPLNAAHPLRCILIILVKKMLWKLDLNYKLKYELFKAFFPVVEFHDFTQKQGEKILGVLIANVPHLTRHSEGEEVPGSIVTDLGEPEGVIVGLGRQPIPGLVSTQPCSVVWACSSAWAIASLPPHASFH